MQSKQESNYDFLNLSNEENSSAVTGQAKTRAILFSVIQKNTGIRATKDASLFDPNFSYTELSQFGKDEIADALLMLVQQKSVLSVYQFKFDVEAKKLIVLPAFISKPSSKQETIFDVYNQLVINSIEALSLLIKSSKPINKDTFLQMLKKDLTQTEKNTKDNPLLFHLLEFSQKANFLHSPNADFFLTVTSDLLTQLSEKNIAPQFNNESFLLINNEMLPDYYAWASDFFQTEILPTLKNKTHFQTQLEKIQLNKQLHNVQFSNDTTADFIRMKAQAFEDYHFYKMGSHSLYPGSLTAFVLIHYAKQINQHYKQQKKIVVDKNITEIKNQLKNYQMGWEKLIFFIDEHQEFHEMADTKRRLENDAELVHDQWQFPTGHITGYVFVHAQVIRTLVNGMTSLEKNAYWKVLLLKNIVEKAEDRISALFKNPEFVKSYGKLMRMAYIEEIPWYLKIFVKFNIPVFIDIAFQTGKINILEKQKILKEQNSQQRKEQQKKIDLHLNQLNEKILETEAKSLIVKAINDNIYLQNRFPVLHDIRQATGFEQTILAKWIAKLQFNEVTPPPGSSSYILYPFDQNWHANATKLYQHIEKKMLPLASKEKKEICENIKLFLDKNLKKPLPPTEQTDDPYLVLSKLIKQKEKSLKHYF